ncbi:hypothetical protein LWI29_014219 [Acer saccharum]|uniref:DUF4283 domain-containing protein n=1 Tax=Acer saccharum TaxID=4024 RepID=A0AA39RH94_ACESA|nr:hypothetical protein LWI29_014219 [Acer saccharum]
MKSYAQAISSAIAPLSSAPKKKGDYVAIKVNPKAYEERLKLCSYSLIGRVVLSKGEEPWKILALKEKLQSIWKLNSQWRLISLGRGFFQILLNSEEDKAQVWGIGSLHLKPGILRLQPWTQNFNPNTQRTTNAQIWVRFYDLPWEFWHPQILSDMARGVGIPLKFDRATLEGDYGHFARMLIDVDLSKPLPDSIMIEVGEDCLFPTLFFENVPSEVDSNEENDKIYPVLAAMSTHIRKVEALRDAIRKMKVVRDVITKCTSNAPAGRHRVYGDCPMDIAWLRLQLFEVTEEAHRLLAELDLEFGSPPGPSSLPAN